MIAPADQKKKHHCSTPFTVKKNQLIYQEQKRIFFT